MLASPEYQTRRTEIINLGRVDVLVNHRQTDVSEKDLEELKQNIVLGHTDIQNKDILHYWTMVTDGNKIGFLNSENNPKYFAKKKWITPDHDLFKSVVNMDRGELGSKFDIRKTDIQLTDSILSEMSLCGEINSLVEKGEAQEIFLPLGINQLKFVQPLVGIIDRHKKEKYVIYRYVDGTPWYNSWSDQISERDKISSVRNLKSFFNKNGLVCEDLEVKQLLFDEETKDLFLIDTEGYFRSRG